MARDVVKHDTIKKIIGAFASILDEIRYIDGRGIERTVPLVYSPKEKFLEDIRKKPDMDDFAYDIVLPRIGFEVEGMNFAPERHTNPLGRINDAEGKWVYNRVPWDFSVSVTVAATRMNDGNNIIENIIPYFTPEFTVTVKDIPELSLETNMVIVLNSVAMDIEYEGTYDAQRTLTWTMQFTVKAYLYQQVVSGERIKETIVNLNDQDFDNIFERLTNVVVPREANENDVHTIVETIETEPEE